VKKRKKEENEEEDGDDDDDEEDDDEEEEEVWRLASLSCTFHVSILLTFFLHSFIIVGPCMHITAIHGHMCFSNKEER
jgi:hypothetical protein